MAYEVRKEGGHIQCWASVIIRYASAQLVVQAIGITCGILIVRYMDKTNYVYYTISISMLSMLSILSNSGIVSAMLSIGGKCFNDPERMGSLIDSAIQLKKYLASFALIIVSPLMTYLLFKNGAPLNYIILLLITVIFTFVLQISNSINRVSLTLREKIDDIQRLDMILALSRITMISIAIIVYLTSYIALLVATAMAYLEKKIIQRSIYSIGTIKKYKLSNRSVDDNVKKEIKRVVKYQLPNTIFVALQGQILVLLISLFGGPGNVADIGALSRLVVIYTIVNAVMSNILMPGFARCQTTKILIVRCFQIVGIYFFIALAMILAAYLAPEQILWFLGEKYSHLKDELLLIIISNGLIGVANAMVWLNMAKSWIKYHWVNIPLTISLQVFLVLHMDLSILSNVIKFQMISVFPTMLIALWMTYVGIKQYAKEDQQYSPHNTF